jgi:glycosyltransferase involved in cell wall biosynthesis
LITGNNKKSGMKILMLLENEYRKDGRVEKEVRTLFKAGHEVIVAAINISDLPCLEKRDDCIVLRRDISKIIIKSSVAALKLPLYFSFWRRYLKSILKHHRIDAIHIHDLPLCKIGIEAQRDNEMKLVLDLHENWPALLNISKHTNTFLGKILSSEKQWRRYEKMCVSNADAVITVVAEMKERILRYKIPSEKISVLENTPEKQSHDIIEYERDERYYTLIYIGSISFHRGLQYIIDGIKLLIPKLPVRLWIVGDGKYSSTLKNQVMNLQLQDHVIFYGAVTKQETEDLMKKADLGLIPHIRSEQSDNSSPNKLFEYMAAGLPVIASDCVSVKRVLDETICGVTYIFDSPADFATVVSRLYYNPEKSDIFAINGRKAIKEKYNWEQSSVSLQSIYSDID